MEGVDVAFRGGFLFEVNRYMRGISVFVNLFCAVGGANEVCSFVFCKDI